MTPNVSPARVSSLSSRKTRQERQTSIRGSSSKKESTPDVKPRCKELPREIESFLEDPNPSLWLPKADPFDFDDHCGRVRHTRSSLAKMECLANDMPIPPEKNLNVVHLMLEQIGTQDQDEEGLDTKERRASDVSIDVSESDEEKDEKVARPLRRMERGRFSRKPLNTALDDSKADASLTNNQVEPERSMHHIPNRHESLQQSTQASNVESLQQSTQASNVESLQQSTQASNVESLQQSTQASIVETQREQPHFEVHYGGNIHQFGPASRQYQAFAHFWETIKDFSGEVSGPVKVDIPGSADPGLQPLHTSEYHGQSHNAVIGRTPYVPRAVPRRKRPWSRKTSPERHVSETEAERSASHYPGHSHNAVTGRTPYVPRSVPRRKRAWSRKTSPERHLNETEGEKTSKTPKPKALEKSMSAQEASQTSRSQVSSSPSKRSRNGFFERYNAQAQASKDADRQRRWRREARESSIFL